MPDHSRGRLSNLVALGTQNLYSRPFPYLLGYKFHMPICSRRATIKASSAVYDALGLQMTTLADVGEMLRDARHAAGLSQKELAEHAGVARTTLARMETLARGDMSVSALVRLLEAAGYDLRVVKRGHGRTLDDVLAEQRTMGDA
jgi:ribosome-binding protein aMBF1 (putative translation factor)